MARNKRSHNKGYWFRAGRGWYVTEGKSSKPLLDDKGKHIKSADEREEADKAYARYLLQEDQPVKQTGLTVLEACQAYLDHAQSGPPETYRLRAGYLYDLCHGFSARFRDSAERPPAKDRIHPGYGGKPVAELTRLDVEKWVKAHTGQKERTIYVPEEIAEIVRGQLRRHKGRVFRNEHGQAWTLDALESAFRRLKRRLQKKEVTPDEPLIPYTCRHTYAKRMLGGFWGAPVTLEVLAGLMGNTPAICRHHYAKWSQQYTDPFWTAIQGPNSIRETFGSVK